MDIKIEVEDYHDDLDYNIVKEEYEVQEQSFTNANEDIADSTEAIRIKTEEIAEDEHKQEFPDLIVIDDEADFSSDDELPDTAFIQDHEIRPEDAQCILQCIEDIQENDIFNETETAEFVEIDVVEETHSAIDEARVVDAVPSTSTPVHPGTSSTPVFKTSKRARSPLTTMEDSGPMNVPSVNGSITQSVESISKDAKDFSNIKWKKKSMRLHVNKVAFRGDSSLPKDVKALRTPMEMFCYFFTKEIVQKIAEEANRAALIEDKNTTFKCDIDDLYHYIGILIYMSVYRYPNLNMYWGKNAFAPIQKAMCRTRFKTIRKHLCLRNDCERVNNRQHDNDSLFHVRNMAEQLNERFDSIPKQARLCVDEQICSTKTERHLRQCIPRKSQKWGKLYVLCDSFGYVYRFEICTGAGDNPILSSNPDLGSTSNIVVQLTQTVTNFVHHIVYFDNFYASIPLLVYLHGRGIYSLSTVCENRIPNSKLPTDSDIKDKPRGYSTEFVGAACGVDISNVLWKDNKSVRLISTYVGIKPFVRANPQEQAVKATRYDRKKKKHVEINCPQIVREYNQHIGGADLMNRLMGRYNTRQKTRDSITRLFYHFIDMAVTNAYILYRRIHAERSNDSEDVSTENGKLLKLPEFREEIAAGLVAYTKKRLIGRVHPSTSRPSKTQKDQQKAVLKLGEKAKHPTEDVRFDSFGHFPIWLGNKSGKRWCKLCKKSKTQCVCSKCDLHLCCSNAKNCFYDYHNKK
ncbi:piggyBac transposable element-derived protein 4-like isoform X1 [Phlebotomus papatasi]|uniref:piggyBac transposable element-derived protein 4-like isoform X1 n=1 Tax=Phlebotomus papatasi TaxID=29031 RepID=UPI002483CD30|nr:piggyBac transposable element-derived protein 4-like isoform X1 [Phlebotomus papatasi]